MATRYTARLHVSSNPDVTTFGVPEIKPSEQNVGVSVILPAPRRERSPHEESFPWSDSRRGSARLRGARRRGPGRRPDRDHARPAHLDDGPGGLDRRGPAARRRPRRGRGQRRGRRPGEGGEREAEAPARDRRRPALARGRGVRRDAASRRGQGAGGLRRARQRLRHGGAAADPRARRAVHPDAVHTTLHAHAGDGARPDEVHGLPLPGDGPDAGSDDRRLPRHWGLVTGSVYMLLATGITLIFGVMKVANYGIVNPFSPYTGTLPSIKAFAVLAAVRELFVLQVLSFVFIFAIYAQSWNLAAHSGQHSLGHATFLGLGSYGSILLATRLGVPPAVALFLGPLLPALAGLGIGALCRRLREAYFGMVTFGCSTIIQVLVVEQFGWLTNRWDGLDAPRLAPEGLAIERAAVFNYLVGLALMVATYVGGASIMRSRTGLAFVAIHDNETVAAAAGVSVVRYRLLAMTAGGYIAGLAGARKGHTLTPHHFPRGLGIEDSVWPGPYSIPRGLGTAEGPLLRTPRLRGFWERSDPHVGGFDSLILIGLSLALVVTALPRGVYPVLARAVATVGVRVRPRAAGRP